MLHFSPLAEIEQCRIALFPMPPTARTLAAHSLAEKPPFRTPSTYLP